MTKRADVQAAAFVLAVPDADATADWWVEVMGFEHVLKIPGWTFVRRGACVLRLGSCPDALPPKDLGDHSYFGYITVDSVNSLYEEINSTRKSTAGTLICCFRQRISLGASMRWAFAHQMAIGSCLARSLEELTQR